MVGDGGVAEARLVNDKLIDGVDSLCSIKGGYRALHGFMLDDE